MTRGEKREMREVEFIQYKGRKILRIGFEGELSKERIKAIMEEAKKVIAGQPPNSILAMTIFGYYRFDSEIAALFREYVAFNKPYIKASAVIGVVGLRKALYNAFTYITHRNVMICQDEEEAKEYLAALG